MTKRIFATALVLTGLLACILGKMAYTQLYQGPAYAAQSFTSRANSFALEDIRRGDILDRHGDSLLDSQEQPALVVFPALLDNPAQVLSQFQQQLPQLSLTADQLLPTITDGKTILPPPFSLLLSDEATLATINSWHTKGLVIAPYKIRYGSNPLALHLIGTLDSDGHGTKGIEKRYDAILQGKRPTTYLAVITDAQHNLLEGVGLRLVEQEDPQRGNVTLTIDKATQQSLEDALNQHHVAKGAAVILDTASGEILAAASRPIFDPHNLTQTYGFSDNQLERVMGDDYTYYPGSSFKLVTALAALEEEQATATTTFLCDNQPPYSKCPREHGQLDFAAALKVSCNNYFIHLGQQLGQQKLTYYMLDQLDFQLEKNKALDSFAARANGVIGQELIKLSPLQMANLSAMIANDGLWQPLDDPWENRLIFHEADHPEDTRQPSQPTGVQVFSPATVHALKAMLASSWQDTNGRTHTYGGKTGTPEIYSNAVGKHYLAWYTGYTPAENPRYAIAIVVEEIAGKPLVDLAGGKDALPIFKTIVEALSTLSDP